MGAGYVRALRVGFFTLPKSKSVSLRVGFFTNLGQRKVKSQKSEKMFQKSEKIFQKLEKFFENWRNSFKNRISLAHYRNFLWKSLSKGWVFLHWVSLRVTFSPKFSLSKGKGPEVWHAHTRHSSILVPPRAPLSHLWCSFDVSWTN